MGIIDTLSDGFSRVAKRPGLLILPIVVDLSLWLAPRLSVDSLLQRSMPSPADVARLGQPYVQLFDASRALLQDPQATTNLWSAFSLRAIGLSSLTGETVTAAPPWHAGPQVIEIQSWTSALVWSALLGLLSLFLAFFVLALLAQVAREEGLGIIHALEVAARSWARVTGTLVAGVVLLAVLGGGVVLAALLLGALSSQLGNVVLSAFVVSALWVSAYIGLIFFFFVRSVVLDDTGIRRSLWSALNVVHRNFFAVLIFVVLFAVIQTGLLLVWDVLAGSVAGTLVSIVGNAYINTGLVMGSLVFYRDRFVRLQEAAAKSRS